MEKSRQQYEHEHVCRHCFKVTVCFMAECHIDYERGQWLGEIMTCFDCSDKERPTVRHPTVPPKND